MSSILIKGMTMPKDCRECRFGSLESCDIEPTIIRCIVLNRLTHEVDWHEVCPLIEVKPHGRLIDADALMGVIQDYIEEYSDLDENGMHNLKWCAMKETEMSINAAPTIVEADNNTQNMSAESEGEE